MLTCTKLNHLKTNYTLPCAIRVLVHAAAKTVLASICLNDKNHWLLLWVTYILLLHGAVILWGMGDITNVLSVKKGKANTVISNYIVIITIAFKII